MYGLVLHTVVAVVLTCLAMCAKSENELQLVNETQKTQESSLETSLSSYEHTLSMIANLTAAQKLVLEQQNEREREIRAKNREEEAKQAARSNALNNEQNLLREMFATLKRRYKKTANHVLSLNGATNQDTNIVRPKDCADLYLDGEELSGVYKIWPTWSKDKTGFPVYCDMDTDGGGWTVIYRWGFAGFPRTYFRRSWEEYKNGFGDLKTAFWLGNSQIYALTRQGAYQLRFDLDQSGDAYALYKVFWIEDESKKFKVYVEGFKGKEDIFSIHSQSQFSTYDQTATDMSYRNTYDCFNSNNKQQGWWFTRECTLDRKLEYFIPNTEAKKEMKIRPALFQKMKETF